VLFGSTASDPQEDEDRPLDRIREVLEHSPRMDTTVPRLLIGTASCRAKVHLRGCAAGVHQSLTGRIHTSFNQDGGGHGRLSSSDPNLQNISRAHARGRGHSAVPSSLRPAPCSSRPTIPRSRLRLLAHLSATGVRRGVRAGRDIHRQTAAIIFDVTQDQVTRKMRARAKTINFATIYGQGAFALSRQLGITQDDAKRFIEQYFTRFAGVRAWLDRTVAEAREKGYVETLFRKTAVRPGASRTATSTSAHSASVPPPTPLFQGLAADLIKIAMIRIARALKDQALRLA